ncbi:MAG: endonuclease/exonuclease/phosphatase family protein [Alphaproteobacteria bacterium]|nr:endonuclease/exonuclease/phosphatase family protein [Alphaproteobacteria bacterium]
MTSIVSWNIQYGKAADGRIDLARIRQALEAWSLADVICFQEVSDGFGDLGPGAEDDQPGLITGLFPEYRPVFRPAIEWRSASGRMRRFGNMILSRLPVLEITSHMLPRPADAEVKHMRRQVLEVVVESGAGPLRVATTHLEYYSPTQRAAQVGRLLELVKEWEEEAARPAMAGLATYEARPRPIGSVLCGDFNFVPDDDAYGRIVAARDEGRLFDAWPLVDAGRPHRPTCGLFDRKQWPQGPHARDFFFVCRELAPAVAALETQTETDASDHQPVRLRLRHARSGYRMV